MRLALGQRNPIPRIFQVPGPLHLESRLFRKLDLVTAGPSDYWIGSCRATCDIYRACGVPSEKLFLAYYGTDIDVFGGAPGKLRSLLHLSPSTRIIGMVAYFYPPKLCLLHTRGLKGHEDLIDAFALLRRKEPDTVLVIVGGAWNGAVGYEERVRRYARAKCDQGIYFLGERQDVAEIYPDFDVAVHPSHSENVGGAVESLLSGVPTVTTSVGGFSDLVHHGITGWMVPPKQPAQLCEQLLEVLSDTDRARRVAREGRALARTMFDVRNTAGIVSEAYAQIMNAGH